MQRPSVTFTPVFTISFQRSKVWLSQSMTFTLSSGWKAVAGNSPQQRQQASMQDASANAKVMVSCGIMMLPSRQALNTAITQSTSAATLNSRYIANGGT